MHKKTRCVDNHYPVGQTGATDSDADFSKMNNHANRDEVIEARKKGRGINHNVERTSEQIIDKGWQQNGEKSI